jgi:hypothetical protein
MIGLGKNDIYTFVDCPDYAQNICMIRYYDYGFGLFRFCRCNDRRDDPYHFIGDGCPRGYP